MPMDESILKLHDPHTVLAILRNLIMRSSLYEAAMLNAFGPSVCLSVRLVRIYSIYREQKVV